MSNIVVKVNEPRAVVLPPAKVGSAKEQRGLVLIPGENAVSLEYLKALQENPAVNRLFELGVLSVIGEGEAKPLSEGLDSLKVAEARKAVEKISEVSVLQRLRAGTTKKGTLEVIDERIRALSSEAQ